MRERYLSKPLEIEIQNCTNKLHELNVEIIKLEDKKTKAYRKSIEDGLKKAEDVLARHIKSEPKSVDKPKKKEGDEEYHRRSEVSHDSETAQAEYGEQHEYRKVPPLLELIQRSRSDEDEYYLDEFRRLD